MRIQNTVHGAVEVSFDRGQSWLVLARVARPALDRAPGANSQVAMVLRSSPIGIALAIGNGKYIRLVPENPGSKPDPSSITLNVGAGAGPFTLIAPSLESPIQLQVAMRPAPLPIDYMPLDGDILVITVGTLSASAKLDEVKSAARKVADQYFIASELAYKKTRKPPTRGNITLSILVHPGEKPSAIVYKLDGEVVSIQNSAPFIVHQDTRKWADGEHLIDVTAMDKKGGILTRTTSLLFVKNNP